MKNCIRNMKHYRRAEKPLKDLKDKAKEIIQKVKQKERKLWSKKRIKLEDLVQNALCQDRVIPEREQGKCAQEWDKPQ